jgi:hypothetical protein
MFTPGLSQLVALVCLFVSAVGAGVWWWSARRLRESDPPDSAPETLWSCLCRAHDLSPDDAARLAELSHSSGLSDPCLAFVDPRCLSRAAADSPEFARLGRRLFGELFPEAQRV